MVTGSRYAGLPRGLSLLLLLLSTLFLNSAGCVAPESGLKEQSDSFIVFVSIPPQAFVVERIGGGLVDVRVLVMPGQEPHTFEPLPKQMTELAGARLYFKVGMPFEERLVEKIAAGFHKLKVVDSLKGIEKVELHSNSDGHEEHDPHVWLAPSMVLIMAANTAEALSQADPGNKEAYKANLEGLLAELNEVDSAIRERLAPFKGRAFYVLHSAFGHFAEEYGLRQMAMEAEGKLPSPKRLASLIGMAREEGARAVFVQPQFDRKSAEALANAIGGEVVVLDPLAGDLCANLVDIAEALAASFESQRNGTR